ncbi:MAG: ThiF family adenylyltransferase [Bacilli bacterium]|nr:ThiF family adenylyltransferase [Bacilli bacterium]
MYERLELLIGNKINILKEKTILLVGLGGVGGHAFETLIRSGIGTIIVVDNDKIDQTNLNRQILATKNTINQYKVDIAEERKNQINDKIKIIKINEFITKENIDLLFDYKIDFVIDAIDTIKTKEELIKKCLNKKIKIISVMGTGGKMDASLLEITTLNKTTYDKLAKKIRTDLKKEKIYNKIKVVSSTEKPKITKPIGSNAFVPAVAGILAANYAINTLLKE